MTDSGDSFFWPSSKHIHIHFLDRTREEEDNDENFIEEGESYQDAQVYTLPQILAFRKKEGTVALKSLLHEKYSIYLNNKRGCAVISRLANWANENSVPTNAGKELLIELQVLAASLANRDPRAVEARLRKAEYGSNPYLAAMASAPKRDRKDSRDFRDFRDNKDRQGRRQGQGQGQSQPQCAFCGKVGHVEAVCWAKNGRPPPKSGGK